VFVDILDSLFDLFCDVINSAWPAKLHLPHASHMVNDVSAPSGISSS